MIRFLLTNDDGISADGLSALEAAAARLGAEVYVVAPETEQSMCGHRVTTRSILRVNQLAERRWTVAGTPADCVRIALYVLHLKPDCVLSGVNHGGNMGQDAVISGTVAAAREAAYHGVRSMAFSQYMLSGVAFDWERMASWVEQMYRDLSTQPLESGQFWNVNFPHLPPGPVALPEVCYCEPARSPLNVSFLSQPEGFLYSASYAERPQDRGSDVAACFSDKVAVTRLSV